MSPNPPDINKAWCEYYDHNESVIITFDVKNIVLVAYIVCTGKIFAHICKVLPTCLAYFLMPSFQCYPAICMP